MCSTLGLHKKKVYSFFAGVVRLGDVWRGERRGEGGGVVHVSGGRGLHGVSEAGGVI